MNAIATTTTALLLALLPNGRSAPAQTHAPLAVVLSIEGATNAWITPQGAAAESPLRVHQPLAPGDRVRVGERTRLTLQLANRTIVPVSERSEVLARAEMLGRSLVTGEGRDL